MGRAALLGASLPDRTRIIAQVHFPPRYGSRWQCVQIAPENASDPQTPSHHSLSQRLSRVRILLSYFCASVDVVVMQTYEGNDLRDSLRYHEHADAMKEGGTTYADAADRSRRALDSDSIPDGPIGRNSYAINLLVVAAAEGLVEVGRVLRGDVSQYENFRYVFHSSEHSMPMNVKNGDQSEVRSARSLRADPVGLSAFDAALNASLPLRASKDSRRS